MFLNVIGCFHGIEYGPANPKSTKVNSTHHVPTHHRSRQETTVTWRRCSWYSRVDHEENTANPMSIGESMNKGISMGKWSDCETTLVLEFLHPQFLLVSCRCSLGFSGTRRTFGFKWWLNHFPRRDTYLKLRPWNNVDQRYEANK